MLHIYKLGLGTKDQLFSTFSLLVVLCSGLYLWKREASVMGGESCIFRWYKDNYVEYT